MQYNWKDMFVLQHFVNVIGFSWSIHNLRENIFLQLRTVYRVIQLKAESWSSRVDSYGRTWTEKEMKFAKDREAIGGSKKETANI